MFKLPIQYQTTEKTPETMIKDLEIVVAEDGPSMLETLLTPETDLSKKLIPQWASQYTTNTQFLKDTVTVAKRLQIDSHDPTKFVHAWEDLHSTVEFNTVYQYVDYSKLSFLNTMPKFLLGMTVYSLLSPVLFILSPLMMVVVPFIILKVKGIPLCWDQYYTVLTQVLKKHALGGLLLGFKDADAQQRGYMLISATLFVVQLYSNIQSCYQFYIHMNKTYHTLNQVHAYLTHVVSVADQLKTASTGLATYEPFCEDMECHMRILRPFLQVLDTPYQRFMNTGLARYLLYRLKTDDGLKRAIDYSCGLHGYAEIMTNLGSRLKRKDVTPCVFGTKTDFTGVKYPLVNYRRNNVRVKNYMITGPNASGKTTFIKTIMLNIFFSQTVGCGFYTRGKVCPYKNLCCYINIPDTSGRDSLFQAEARRCKEILATVSSGRSFCIFDELFSGTNPQEASASAYAFLQEVVKNKSCTFMLTTHFMDVCERTKNVDNYHMETVDSVYTYAFKKGISYVRGGIDVLTKLQFPASMIECAKNYR